MEYVIGASSVARGLSGYIDALIDNKMGNFWRDLMPIDISFLAEYPDFFAFVIVMILAFLLASGVKESTFLNNVFTAVNLATVCIVLVAGSMNADPKNWTIAKEDIPENIKHGGEGGFMPFGIAGKSIDSYFMAFVNYIGCLNDLLRELVLFKIMNLHN